MYYYWLHGTNKGHHTHQCAPGIQKKKEYEDEQKGVLVGSTVNHVAAAGQIQALKPFIYSSHPYKMQPYMMQQVFQPSTP